MFVVVTFWHIIPFMIFNTLDVVSIESFDPFNKMLDTKIQTCQSLTFKILYIRHMIVQARNILIPLTVSLAFQTLFIYQNNIYQVFGQMNDDKMSSLSVRNKEQRQIDARNETIDVLVKRIFDPNYTQQQISLKWILLRYFVRLFMVYYYIIASPVRFIGISLLIDQIVIDWKENESLVTLACTFVAVGIVIYFVAIYYIICYVFKWKHFHLLLELFVSKLNYYKVEDIPLHVPDRLYTMNDLAQKEMYCIMAENPPLILCVPFELLKMATVNNKLFAMFVNFKYPFEMHMINYLKNVIKHEWIPYLFWNWNGLIYRIYSNIESCTHYIESKYINYYTKQVSVKLLQNYNKITIIQIFKFLFVFCMLGIVPEMIVTRIFELQVDQFEWFPDLYSLIFKMIPTKIIPSLSNVDKKENIDILILVTYPFLIFILHLTIATSYGMIIYVAVVLQNYYYICRWRAIRMISKYVSWSLWFAVEAFWTPQLHYISDEYEFLKKPACVFLVTQFVNATTYLWPLMCNKFESIALMLRTTRYMLDVVVPRRYFTMIVREGICNHVLKWNQIQNLLVHSLLLEYLDNNEFMCQIIFEVRCTFLFACLEFWSEIVNIQLKTT